MKKLAILVLVLTSFTSVFAMSEKSEVTCSKMNQDSAYQEVVSAPSAAQPVKTPATAIKK